MEVERAGGEGDGDGAEGVADEGVERFVHGKDVDGGENSEQEDECGDGAFEGLHRLGVEADPGFLGPFAQALREYDEEDLADDKGGQQEEEREHVLAERVVAEFEGEEFADGLPIQRGIGWSSSCGLIRAGGFIRDQTRREKGEGEERRDECAN